MRLTPLALLAVTVAVTPVAGGPLAYAACQTGMLKIPRFDLPRYQSCSDSNLLEGCNGLAVACYAAAGFTFGVTIVGAPPAIMGCNLGLGTCMATCATVGLLAPTP